MVAASTKDCRFVTCMVFAGTLLLIAADETASSPGELCGSHSSCSSLFAAAVVAAVLNSVAAVRQLLYTMGHSCICLEALSSCWFAILNAPTRSAHGCFARLPRLSDVHSGDSCVTTEMLVELRVLTGQRV